MRNDTWVFDKEDYARLQREVSCADDLSDRERKLIELIDVVIPYWSVERVLRKRLSKADNRVLELERKLEKFETYKRKAENFDRLKALLSD